jgi:hypothetical protein
VGETRQHLVAQAKADAPDQVDHADGDPKALPDDANAR